jgi:hypothetical protein
MTRTVFDNAMTAHVWASQSQHAGQSHNGNLWFEGRAIYSYGTHYCAGYVAPGGVFLWNADSSTMTTTSKHLPAVRRAIPGQGYGVPGLTETARTLEHWAGRTRGLAIIAKHLESHVGAYWPGAEAAAAIYRGVGASDAEAERRARAGAQRVARAIAKTEADKARDELNQYAGLARGHFARTDPADTARMARDHLAKAADASAYWEKGYIEKAREVAREAHRAAKAAKAKGWTRIAAQCRAHQRAANAELKRFNKSRNLYAVRARLRDDISAIRGAPDQISQFMKLNPQAKEGATVTDYAQAVRGCETGARGLSELSAAWRRVSGSAYACAGLSSAMIAQMRAQASYAAQASEKFRTRATQLRTEWQAEARAEWLAGGKAAPYEMGQLCDERGAALLRAEGVERDDSGAIVGGTLRTSWGATVPLPHAIRAFRFLKYCRDTGTEWRANGRTLRVGHFRVDHVDSAGNFVAGCHKISWAECARLAGALGLAELAGADTTESTESRGVA